MSPDRHDRDHFDSRGPFPSSIDDESQRFGRKPFRASPVTRRTQENRRAIRAFYQPLISLRARFERFDEPGDVCPGIGRQFALDRKGIHESHSPIPRADSEEQPDTTLDFDERKILNFDTCDFTSGEPFQTFAERSCFLTGKSAQTNDRGSRRVASKQVKFHSKIPGFNVTPIRHFPLIRFTVIRTCRFLRVWRSDA